MFKIFSCLTFLVVLSHYKIIGERSHCQCMPLTDCESNLLIGQNQMANLDASLRYSFSDCSLPTSTTSTATKFVCCPMGRRHARHRRTPLPRHVNDDDDDDDRWVWDYHTPLTMKPPTTLNPKMGRSENFKFNDDYNWFEFKDMKTMRNCPPIFYEDHIFDNTPPFLLPFYSPERFQYHHDHDHDPHYNDSTYDRPFVYPDDDRLHRPILFPSDILTSTTSTTKTTTTTTSQPTTNKALINAPDCGLLPNASALEDQHFPWIARIGYLNRTNNRISYRCSGTLISDEYILTAAHCVVDLVPELKVSYVRMDTANMQNATAALIFDIIDIVVHPRFDQPRFSNDIALLKILKPEKSIYILGHKDPYVNVASYTMSAHYNELTRLGVQAITTICLPTDGSVKQMEALIGKSGIVTVWSGNMNGVETTNATVKYVRIPITNTTECAILYARFTINLENPIVIGSKQLCARAQSQNDDVCRGDSGGPFMDDGSADVTLPKSAHVPTKRWSLLGIVAFGPVPCDESSFPGVYTRVSSYVSWIRSTIA